MLASAVTEKEEKDHIAKCLTSDRIVCVDQIRTQAQGEVGRVGSLEG